VASNKFLPRSNECNGCPPSRTAFFYILFLNTIAHLPISEYDTNGYRKYAMKMADIRVENGVTDPLTVFI